MKNKIFIAILIVAVISVVGAFYKNSNDKIGGWTSESDTILGSSTNAVSVPRNAVFAKSTTTPATGEYGMTDGGAVVSQDFVTENFDEVKLYVSAIAPTATSTLYIRQMASFDDHTYFDIASSTSSILATTTYEQLPVKSIAVDPSTATTTVAYSFDTLGFKHTRFVVWSEGWTGDLDTGVQAYIKVIKVDNK